LNWPRLVAVQNIFVPAGIFPRINRTVFKMNERILCVDDDPHILEAYQRTLHKQFIIDGALGGEEALNAIATQGPYAVVVADMLMPGMNGIELLVKISEAAPDTVRMILTGNADLQTTLDAVNEGHIFRFMTKPCPPEIFAKVLEGGIAQYRLITAEHVLLSHTLGGCIKVLTDVLGLANPLAFGRASRVYRLVHQLCREMGLRRTWTIEVAAMLSQIGCVAVPEKTLSKVYKGKELYPDELKAFLAHPQIGRELLIGIPRLEEVAEIIAHQNDSYRDEKKSLCQGCSDDVFIGSCILKAVLDWDMLVSSGMSKDLAMAEINERKGYYHRGVLAAMRKVMKITMSFVLRRVRLDEVFDGAVLADDVRSLKGSLLCSKGQEVTHSMRVRLRNYDVNAGVRSPIKIFVPVDYEPQERNNILFSAVSAAK
jgi:response regulator RpfG family c-di-GMP phosphodiesterase